MKRSAVIVLSAFALAVAARPAAVEKDVPKPVISVAATGKATAKPDLAIVFVSTRTSAPLAADALEQNRKKVQEIKAKLSGLGYRDQQVRLTGNRFSPSGQGMFYPGGQRPTGFDVYSNIYVFLDGNDLKNIDEFNSKVGLLLDELSKIGASPVQTPISPMSMGGVSIVAFTVKDPTPIEKQAYSQALDKAKPIGEEIAQRMGVKITGIDSVTSSALGRTATMGPVNPLDDLEYEYLSSSIEEVPIRVRMEVKYSYR